MPLDSERFEEKEEPINVEEIILERISFYHKIHLELLNQIKKTDKEDQGLDYFKLMKKLSEATEQNLKDFIRLHIDLKKI